MKPAYIYALCEPITQEVRYIGLTTNLATRYAQHISRSNYLESTNLKATWIRGLASRNLIPSFLVLQVTDVGHAEEIEEIWITYYLALGARLTNQDKVPNQVRTPRQAVRILAPKAKHMTFIELGKRLGRSEGTLRYWYKELYGHYKGRKTKPLTPDEIKELTSLAETKPRLALRYHTMIQ